MKWVLIIVGGIAALLVLIGGLGYYFLTKPIDPESDMGRQYAQKFKASFVEKCITTLRASASDQAMERKVQTACDCAADASYHEIKDTPLMEQYARLQDPDMQEKLGSIMQTCKQGAGLQ